MEQMKRHWNTLNTREKIEIFLYSIAGALIIYLMAYLSLALAVIRESNV